MADYTWSVGSSGTMLIRDTGTYVEFWLKAGSGTFNYALPWGYTVNGVTDNSNSFRFESGGSWQRLGRWLVTTDQTVTFRLYNTGTSGLGSGETHSVAVDRTNVPPAPSIAIATPGETTMYVNANSNGNGGLAIDQFQLRYDEDSAAGSPGYLSLSLDNGTGTVTGLTKGVTYYLWVRAHNSKGWGAWSGRVSRVTWTNPAAPTKPVISDITQSSVVLKFTDGAANGTPITLREVGYRRPGTTEWTVVPSTGSSKISGLPGGTLEFAARTWNAVGVSPWSTIAVIGLVAGAWVNVDGVWYQATPYVRVDGVWIVAKPWVKIAGMWKGTK